MQLAKHKMGLPAAGLACSDMRPSSWCLLIEGLLYTPAAEAAEQDGKWAAAPMRTQHRHTVRLPRMMGNASPAQGCVEVLQFPAHLQAPPHHVQRVGHCLSKGAGKGAAPQPRHNAQVPLVRQLCKGFSQGSGTKPMTCVATGRRRWAG